MFRFIGGVALLTAVLATAAPAAAVTEDEAARAIAAEYGVEVLKVAPGEVRGRAVWLVTVMNPGGASNSAFMVTTLAVDRESGALVSSFDPSSGALPPVLGGTDRDQSRPDRARGRTWR